LVNSERIEMFLRTGMRMGEFLVLRMEDIDLKERKIIVYAAKKTRVGRVAYFSADATEALVNDLKRRIHGRAHECLPYSAHGRCLPNT